MEEEHWTKRIPWWVKFAFLAGTGLASPFVATYLSENLQLTGLVLGAGLITVSALGSLWHIAGERAIKRGKAKPMLEPIYLVGTGLLIALVGAIWLWSKQSNPAANRLGSDEIARAFC